MATSIGFAKALTRLGNFALDDSSVFTSVVSLNNYLASGTCYAGQVVALVDTTTGKAKIYKTEGLTSPFTITQIDSASISLDNISLDNNSTSKLELKGFETANNDTVVIKNGTGVLGYLAIEKNNTNSYTTVASKEYVDMLVQGGIVLQGVDYDASTNTPDITTVVIGVQAYAWHISVAGTQTLGGKTFNFKVNDWVVKTVSGRYLHIDNNTNTISWGTLSGNIVDQLDLKTALDKKVDKVTTATTNNIAIFDATGNLLDGGKKISDLVLNTTTVNGRPLNANIILDKTDIGLSNVPNTDTTNASNISSGTLPSARLPIADSTNIGGVKQGTGLKIGVDGTIEADIIDDSATTSTTETYSIDKIISLLSNKQNKITISNVVPITPSTNDLWIDTSNSSQYVLKCFNLTWITVGSTSSDSGVKVWTNGLQYDINDLVVFSSNLYLTLNTVASSTSDPSVDTTNFKLVGGSGTSVTFTGDLSGDSTSQKVVGIQGNIIEDVSYGIGDLLGVKSNGKFGKITPATAIGMTGITMIGDNVSIASGEEKTFTHTSSTNVVPYVIEQIVGSSISDTHVDFTDSSKYTLQDNSRTLIGSNLAQLNIDNNSKILMNMDDNTFKDECGHTITNNGVTIDTTNKVAGLGSAYLNGSSCFIPTYSSDFDLGTSNFTIDWWEYKTSSSGGCMVHLSANSTSGYGALAIGMTDTSIYMSSNGTSWDIANGKTFGTIVLNSWQHLAVVRSGSNFYAFRNGVLKDSWTSALALATPTFLNIGKYSSSGNYYAKGNIDQFRIIKKALWTSAFTPPSSTLKTPYLTTNTPLYLKTTGLSNYSLTTVDTITSLTIPVTIPTNTSIKCLFSVDNYTNYLYYDGTSIKKFTGDLTTDWSNSSTVTQIQTLFTNLSMVNLTTMLSSLGIIPMNLDFAFQLNTTNTTVTPAVSTITMVYTTLTHEEYADIGKYDSTVSDYGVKRINNSTLAVKNLKTVTKTIKLLVVTDGSGSGSVDINTLPTF